MSDIGDKGVASQVFPSVHANDLREVSQNKEPYKVVAHRLPSGLKKVKPSVHSDALIAEHAGPDLLKDRLDELRRIALHLLEKRRAEAFEADDLELERCGDAGIEDREKHEDGETAAVCIYGEQGVLRMTSYRTWPFHRYSLVQLTCAE